MKDYKLDSLLSKIKFTREAAGVARCHTVPHIGYWSVGHHTFNMLTMLRLLHPNASLRLVWAILEHDIPERLTGDIPAPSKWYGIVNKDKLRSIEKEINIEIFGVSAEDGLTEDELKWLSGLDILELYMWCRDQIQLGNRNCDKMIHRINGHIKRNTHLFAKEIVDLYFACYGSAWEMLPDLGDEA